MPNAQSQLENQTLAFANSGTISGSVFLGGNALIGLAIVGTWTASIMTFRVSLDGRDPNADGTWLAVSPIGSAGTEYSIPAASLALGTTYIPIPPADLPAVYWLQAKSGAAALTNAGGTAQGAARTFVVFTRPV